MEIKELESTELSFATSVVLVYPCCRLMFTWMKLTALEQLEKQAGVFANFSELTQLMWTL